MELLALIDRGIVLLDGGMGTMLQQRGIAPGERPELLSITHPEEIAAIHREYIESGADIVYANTFGASDKKLAGTGYDCKAVIAASIAAAKAACVGTEALVALDIGPLGELLEPAGTLRFEEAYGQFAAQALAGEQAGADLAVIETMADLLETKAAVLAVRENTTLPVLITMTFEESGRTFTGVSPEAAAITLTALGVTALGINCSQGPKALSVLLERMAAVTPLPLILKANAGLPDPKTGLFLLEPGAFAGQSLAALSAGVRLFGGCCGTTPKHIAALKEALSGAVPVKRVFLPKPRVCSQSLVVTLDQPRVVGERINPTGKKRFQEALLAGNLDYILAQGLAQADAGAEILDVNVGHPGVDEPAMLVQVTKGLQAVLELPLQLDSTDPKALAAALRIYNGKPIVNSVNGEQAVLDAVLPLVKRYGAAVIGLTLDKNGIPKTAGERVSIAKRILSAALAHGIPKEDVYIDCLTLTASAEQAAAGETLQAVRIVTEELGLATALGVSNISFGLPGRELLNQSFLLLALGQGLKLPIINPNIASMLDAVSAFRVLDNSDTNATAYIGRIAQQPKAVPEASVSGGPIALGKLIGQGLAGESALAAKELLKTVEPLELVNTQLIPALDEVGVRFEKGELYLPQLLQAAAAAQAAFEEVKRAVAKGGTKSADRGTIVLATVRGDIHDIGKNIVKVILENYGFTIIDLGRDVPPEAIVEAAERHGAALVGLSALMTTTLGAMGETIRLLRERLPEVKVFVGGAVLTADFAKELGADHYAKDAKQAADIAKHVLAR